MKLFLADVGNFLKLVFADSKRQASLITGVLEKDIIEYEQNQGVILSIYWQDGWLVDHDITGKF